MHLAAIAAGVLAVAAVVHFAPARGDEPCASVDRGVLPEWARTGFSDPRPRMPHVLGDDGRIVAIIFGDPLVAPPGERANKILWVPRTPLQRYGALRISARRGDRVVRRTVAGGPGPSIVDLPQGCWHLTLRWADEADSLVLRYR
jgi:hypothetical protein